MAETLSIDDKIYHPIRDAAKDVAYSRDYVTRLAREEKINATQVGRQWFVEIESLRRYADDAKHEHAIRKQQLSEQRKRERHLAAAAEAQQAARTKQATGMHGRAVLTTIGVLLFGVVSGALVHQTDVFDATQLAVGITPTQSLADSALGPRTVPREVPSTEVAQRTVSPLGSGEHGYLLLPSHAHASASELFSDEVAVEEVAPGRYEVTRVNATGEAVGGSVPIIRVPINAATP